MQIGSTWCALDCTMALTLRFRDHEEFHRAAVDMAICGGLMGLAAHVAGLMWPSLGPLSAPWPLAAVAAAAAFGATPPKLRAHLAELGRISGLAALSGVALWLLTQRGPEPSLGVALFAATFGLLVAGRRKSAGADTSTARRTIVTVAIGAGVALAARFVLTQFVHADQLAKLPAWLVAGMAGGAFALVAVLALLPRHVEVGRDRVTEAFDGCHDAATGEVRVLVERAMEVWRRVATSSLAEDDDTRKTLEDSVVRLFEVARRWQEVERDGARTSAEALMERMEQLDAKIARLEDPIARGQYAQARAALAEQLRYLNEIGTSRERVVARMHHYLAAMERLRFAVINHRSADASRLSTEVQPILDDLRDLGKEIDCTSEALGEVERAATSPAAAPPAQA